ncbi:aminotransferase class I/II-fold pyridoxal phosphate-dependent enzyme [Corynebacterium sp. zg-331]|uniref:MalY/PatB family protein n=1 Tax=unclassified Corynebacterium TaxID=2624378 RepID=UPI00128E690C|nr:MULTISPECIES: aminotransferase class I/II-fold pyridoxal phosphate-dependent enzyme [unclassified Corynebacterium]MBC3185105.1 aminotransferase class I/II-fold pyridoxal phosphate-dependent enzyme [Corynebacterium sp. zg-331]MPV51603.1 aminotransferase class I/II-fold pyridoxal phosphate-dependent enzyme [Corynebacterium sp. zg331]
MHTPDLDTLRTRRTRKWTAYPDDVLPAWIAESDFSTCPAVKEAIAQRVAAESFGYTPATSEVPEALADFSEHRYGWRPDPESIVEVPDVVRGLTLAVQFFTRPDSPVVVPTPAYPPFLSIPDAAGRERVDVDARGGLDLDEIERAFAQGAGSILLCSPHNPLGYTFDEEFLHDLVALAQRHGARVLVDEIHAPLVLDGDHVAAAGLSDEAAQTCVTVTATSKAWNIAGLKCAQMILSNPDDLRVWRGLNPVVKDGVGTLGVFAAAACYRHGEEFLDRQVACLRDHRDWLVEELPRRIPGLRIARPKATYLMWLDFRETALGATDDPAGHLLRHGRVALNDGRHFGPGGEGHARLNFATSRENLEDIVHRLALGSQHHG